jgi:hypothetical protein
MIGGPPVAQPYYPYPYPAPAQSPGYVQQPRPQMARPAAPPVARGQMPEEAPRRSPQPIKLEMPSPEALGVPTPPPPLDWTDVRVRLDRMGATGFSLDQQADGFHFRCQIASGGQPRTLEGHGMTEDEAVQQALRQAGGR